MLNKIITILGLKLKMKLKSFDKWLDNRIELYVDRVTSIDLNDSEDNHEEYKRLINGNYEVPCNKPDNRSLIKE